MISAKEVFYLDIDKYWPSIVDLVEAAMNRSRGRYTAASIYNLLIEKKMQLWLALNEEKIYAIGITELIEYPTGAKVCRFLCITGEERAEWQHLMTDVENAAKLNNCNDMELMARPGWERVMKNVGYKITHVQLNKTLR